ncbi:hypothetical protein GUITHDRAFT_160025 [Guillardia theta CCMP2712]|uniref:GDP-L-fucose synthase n=1 Tax=Guillardia theta (strain CCMP2712) TaxID=905079 RepID=L1ITU0_GUITC|nr:hypothetical protein GUITHDRAFT_160025 [Guillardia theta CCMP2712]EKX39255.1 hypothetical protein GUITHDRAFT_160025 [Guillardia theta CCMP2712]|eukprot:XP_005826235.1 hypothetical protein GUITHDRAFT_160025 [Guillardia theta CCMP2712]
MAVVLVTGGSGLVGKAIEWQVEHNHPSTNGAKFIFLSSKDADLRNLEQTRTAFMKHKPTHVIHLAARVGGLFKNMRSKVEMMTENIMINQNVLQCAHECGVDRCVSMTSTCVFPDKIPKYPITEDQLHDGPPHPSNEGYAYAKRMLEVLSRAYNEQYDRSYLTVIPTNVFGPHDNYSIEDGHVAPGLMHKCYLAKQRGEDLIIWGTGKPLRQFIFSRDLADLVIWATLTYTGKDSLMLCPDENEEITISELAKTVAECMDFPLDRLKYDTSKADGQEKKTVSNSRLRGLRPDFHFTPFKDAMKISTDWFQENYDKCRM